MYDSFDRRIHYLRISVTDRCNHRCVYCMPAEGVTSVSHDRILSYEQIADVARCAVDMGVDKVRVTGGEPLVRKGVVDLVAMLAAIEGIVDLAMTTNGVLLSQYADELAAAGLGRINVSLDTLDEQRFRDITRGGQVKSVLAGIEAARRAGLTPIKLNCVVQRSSDEADARAVKEFGDAHGYEVRFIRQMDIAKGQYWPIDGGTGGDCVKCNRLRLSSEGLLRPCLFSDLVFDVSELGAEEAIRQAVTAKPQSGKASVNNTFYSVGG